MGMYTEVAKYIELESNNRRYRLSICSAIAAVNGLKGSYQLQHSMHNMFKPVGAHTHEPYFSIKSVGAYTHEPYFSIKSKDTFRYTKKTQEHRILSLLLLQEIIDTGGL